MDFSLFGDARKHLRKTEEKMKALQQGFRREFNTSLMPRGPHDSYSEAQSHVYVESSSGGRPRVYQEAMVARAGPGGAREVKREVYDNTKGRKLTQGRALGDKGHIMTREMDIKGTPVEESQDLYNLNDEEEDIQNFHREWEQHMPRRVENKNDRKNKYLTRK